MLYKPVSPQISVIQKSTLANKNEFEGNTEAYFPITDFALRDPAERSEGKTFPCRL